VTGIDLRLLQDVSLTGAHSALPGEKKIQESDEKGSTNEQEALMLDRLPAFITPIFCHVRHGVQQSIQRDTDLGHFRACVVGGVLFRVLPDVFPFCRGDGRPFLRQELHGRACHGKVIWSKLTPDRLNILQLTWPHNGLLHAEFLYAVRARVP